MIGFWLVSSFGGVRIYNNLQGEDLQTSLPYGVRCYGVGSKA